MQPERSSSGRNNRRDPIGLAIVTFNRPAFFSVAHDPVMKHLIEPGIVESFAICNDGSDPEHKKAYSRAWQRSAKLQTILGGWGREHNHGVGAAKNRCLEFLLDRGRNWLFLMEDDLEVLSADAISGYIEACLQSDWQHLCFHGHGPLNPAPRWNDEIITSWPNSIGAFCIYSRQALERCGLFDEHFHNAWEHVEHTERLASEGFTAPWPDNLDATGSENWLREQPGAAERSSIRHTPEWTESMEADRNYRRETRPDTYHRIWRE